MLLLALGGMTFLYLRMRSVNPETHRIVDRALRDMRGLDRTINQDVLRARYRLLASYHPVLMSYRQLEALENSINEAPPYLDADTAAEYRRALDDYRHAITQKQRTIEAFKYRSADLNVLLNYLPGAGSSVAKAAGESGEQSLIDKTNHVVSLALLYNLTSDEAYAPRILRNTLALESQAEKSKSLAARRQVRTFARNVRGLLEAKPQVDGLLQAIFAAPIAQHEDRLADIYYSGYGDAEAQAGRYRLVLYGMSIALMLLVGIVVARLKLTARALAQSNESLEARVDERTRELDTRNAEMHAVLDNVAQALLTVDAQGRVRRERSKKVASWLPDAREGTLIWDAIRPHDATAADWLALGWEELIDDVMPQELVLDQLPKRFSTTSQHFEVEYRPIQGETGHTERFLLVFSDITNAVAHERREQEQQEQLVAFQHFVSDRAGFLEFVAECDRIFEHLAACWNTPGEAFRAVHTLKGNCGLFGVRSVASACHELESKMVEEPDLAREACANLEASWKNFNDGFLALTGEHNDSKIEFYADDLASLRRSIRSGASAMELLGVLDRLVREPIRARLERLGDHARDLAQRLGKGQIQVVIEDNGVRLDEQRWAPFWAACIHVLRNAIDHGLETPEARESRGKNAFGTLRLTTREEDASLVVEFSDDGRGIDWIAVGQKASQRGLPAATTGELQALLFLGGISTKDSPTEYSGRGAGLSATYEACRRLGGSAEIISEHGQGTTFRFRIPHDDTILRRSILPPGSARFLSNYPLIPSSQKPGNVGQDGPSSHPSRRTGSTS